MSARTAHPDPGNFNLKKFLKIGEKYFFISKNRCIFAIHSIHQKFNNMTAEIKDNKLVITIDFNEAGTPSSSGKSTLHATTNGNKPTNLQVGGKDLVVSVNAYTSKK